MKCYQIKELSNIINLSGSYDSDSYIYLIKEALNSLENFKVNLKIIQVKLKHLIKNLQIYYRATNENITISIGLDSSKLILDNNVSGKYYIEFLGFSEVRIGANTS